MAGRDQGDGSGRGPRERDPHLVGQFETAARELREAGAPTDAGWLLVALVQVELRRPSPLDPEAARIARSAATMLTEGRAGLAAARVAAAAGEPALATELLRAGGAASAADRLATLGRARLPLDAQLPGLTDQQAARSAADPQVIRQGARRALARIRSRGRTDVALMLASSLGMMGEARRATSQLGAIAQRAEQLSRRGRALEAARGWVAAGQPAVALQDVQRVPTTHPDYREACVLAASLAHSQDVLSYELDHMLAGFMASPPRLAEEIEAFRLLARLYAGKAQKGQARELLTAALAVAPERSDLAAARDALGPATQVATGRDGDLPELPSLPSLPMIDLPTLAELDPPPTRPANPTIRAPRPSAATMVPAEDARGDTMVPVQDDLPTPVDAGAAPTCWESSRQPEQPRQAFRPVQPAGQATAVFSPGAVVAERYCIEAELGEGGMGTVFRAQDLELGEAVALKVLTVPVRSEKLVERFRRELRLARRLTHENVVRLHDIGLHQGWRYISMELLDGADLGEHMAEGRLAPGLCVDVIRQAAAGLQAAHDQGVVHRDIKPANLFLSRDGRVKVMDFGLAATQGRSGMTQVGMIAGSPAYMAPEQGAGLGNATALSDLYALGVVAYELFTGRQPFQHEDLLALLRLHAEAAPPAPRAVDPTIGGGVEAEILRALSKAPAARHADCTTFAAALEAAWKEPELAIEG